MAKAPPTVLWKISPAVVVKMTSPAFGVAIAEIVPAVPLATGVQIDAGSGNSVLGDSIFSNTGLGINLTSGANNNIPAPVISKVTSSDYGYITTIAGTLALAAWARRTVSRRRLQDGRAGVALTAISGGVMDAVGLIRAHDWRLLGAVAYWLLDNLALYACLAAFAHAPSVWVVGMAYLVGMLANSIPVPGGFIAVEGGLVGMLVLFGARPASVVLAAVVMATG